MNVNTVYQIVKDRLNKGSTSFNQNISERQFVFAFNKMQLHWMNTRIKLDEADQNIQESLQQFIIEKESTPSTILKEYISIKLPENYFRYKRVKGIVCGKCGINVYAYPREESNANRLLSDSNQMPSLEWEETFFTLGNDLVKFYTDNKFKCEKILLVYYRTPLSIDMKEIIDSQTTHSDIDPEIDKIELEEVIDLTVRLLSGDIKDQFTNQITSNRINNG